MNNHQQLIQQTVDYYSQNPTQKRCTGNGGCYYSPKTAGKPHSDGCAVGRLLTPEQREILDDLDFGPIICPSKDYIEQAPFLKDLFEKYSPDFLGDLQQLHDHKEYWNENGLTNYGKRYVEKLIVKYS